MGRKPAKVYTSINKAYRDINTVVFSLLVNNTNKGENGSFLDGLWGHKPWG